MWYRDGTYSFEKESTKVTGVGTSWADAKFGVLPGMIMVDADGRLHEIDRVLSNTELLIAEPYTGESVSDVPSRIITTYEGDLSQFSARFSALLKSISTDSRQIRNWLTSSVPVTITRDDGSTFTADSLETIAIDFSENRKWLVENKDAISASGDLAKQAAESAKEAKQTAEITGQLSASAGEYANSAAHSAAAAKASGEAAAISAEAAGKHSAESAAAAKIVSDSVSAVAASVVAAENAAVNAGLHLDDAKNQASDAAAFSESAEKSAASASESVTAAAKSAVGSASSAAAAENYAKAAAEAVETAVSEAVLAASASAESAKASETASKASQEAASVHESKAKDSESKATQAATDAAETLSKMGNDATTAGSAAVAAKASEASATESLKAVQGIAESVSQSVSVVENNVAEMKVVATEITNKSEAAVRAAEEISANIGNAAKSAEDAAASAELAQKAATDADSKVNNPVFSKTVQAAHTESTVPADQLSTKAAFFNDVETDGESEYHPVIKQRMKNKGVSWAASFGWMVSDLLFNLQLINDKGEQKVFGFGTNGDLTAGGKVIPADYSNFNDLYLRRSSDVVQTVNSEIEFKQRVDAFGSDGSRVRLYCNKDGDAGISYQDKNGKWRNGLKLPIAGGGDFALKADHYTKTESDAKYQPKGSYALSDSDTSFTSGTHTIKAIGDYASLILRRGNGTSIFFETNSGAGNIIHRDAGGANIAVLGIPVKNGDLAISGEHYTKPESDNKYRAKNDYHFGGFGVFSGIVSAVKDNVKIEMKAENGVPEITTLHGAGDWKIHSMQPKSGTLAHKEDHYTKVESDSRYYNAASHIVKNSGGNTNDANNIPANGVSFVYPDGVNTSGLCGVAASFSSLNYKYRLQIASQYQGSGETLKFRTSNGDVDKWNSWHQIATTNWSYSKAVSDSKYHPLMPAFEQVGGECHIWNPKHSHYFFVNDANNSGYFEPNKGYVWGFNSSGTMTAGLIPVGFGGTGARDIGGARNNLDVYSRGEADGRYQQKTAGTTKFGSSNSAWSTAQFIEWLKSQGAFNSGHWVSRGTWDYAGNQFINDTGVGNIHLAGCVVQVFGYYKQCTITIITPTTTSNGTTHREYIYVDNDTNYNPGWRRLYNTSAPPSAGEVGAYTKGESDGKYQPKGSYAALGGNDGQDFRGRNANFNDVYIRSDIRVKSELRRIEQPLRKIQMIRGLSYNLQSPGGIVKPSAGLIAQEVMKIMPEAVSQDENGLLRLNYNSVIGLLVEAVKDLKNQVDSLQKQ